MKGVKNILAVLILIPVMATAYCLPGTTYSGEPVREGICAGGNLYFGRKINMYQCLPDGRVGKFIGTYECLDTGSTDAIKSNNLIDVWKPDMEACQEFMNLVYADNCKGQVYISIE